MTQAQSLSKELVNMSIDDLMMLNRMIVNIVKEKQRMNNRVAAVTFAVGDEVRYISSRFGTKVTGKIVETKRTKVVVQSSLGRYLVPAAMLTKI